MASSLEPKASQSTHEQIIEALAKQTDASVERVRAVFEREHARLASDARIKTYVSVIATRLAKKALLSEQ